MTCGIFKSQVVARRLEVDMKTRRLIGSVAVLWTAAIGSAIAAAGYTHPTEGWKPSRTRAEVVTELKDARSQDVTLSSRRDIGAADVGARGPAGSRYSERTRDEVRTGLADQNWSHSPNTPNMPGSLYFGD
jgi:hypothetical protein